MQLAWKVSVLDLQIDDQDSSTDWLRPDLQNWRQANLWLSRRCLPIGTDSALDTRAPHCSGCIRCLYMLIWNLDRSRLLKQVKAREKSLSHISVASMHRLALESLTNQWGYQRCQIFRPNRFFLYPAQKLEQCILSRLANRIPTFDRNHMVYSPCVWSIWSHHHTSMLVKLSKLPYMNLRSVHSPWSKLLHIRLAKLSSRGPSPRGPMEVLRGVLLASDWLSSETFVY